MSKTEISEHTIELSGRQQSALRDDVSERLLADSDAIARTIAHHIVDAGGLGGEFQRVGYLRTVLAACRDAVRTLVRLLHSHEALDSADLVRLGSMGARQADLGVPLEVLLAAYRLAAKVVWREVMDEVARVDDLAPATAIAVTERVFEYLDEISGAVGAAYLQTREQRLRERDRSRDRVLQSVLAGDVSTEVRQLAGMSGVELAPPYHVVALAMADGAADPHSIEQFWRLRRCHVVPQTARQWIVLVPAHLNPTQLLAHVGAEQVRAGIGPQAATLEAIADAAARARATLATGELLAPAQRIHSYAELALFTTLQQDAVALHQFAQFHLGELATDTRPRGTTLRATLAAVLDSGNVNGAAAQLGVHRHTVVYRLERLADMGIDTTDERSRHQLWLALQALRLLQAREAAS